MNISGKIKVDASPVVNAPARQLGSNQRFGVGEQIKLMPLQSLPTGSGTWSITSGGGQIRDDGNNVATYTARDLGTDDFLQNKRSYDVVLELRDGSGSLAKVEFTVVAPDSAWLLKLGPKHQQGSANSGFWGIWVLGPKDVSFMNIVIKESRGTINSEGVMRREAGTIHRITGGIAGDWLDALVMTDKGTAFAAFDDVWTPADTPPGGWQAGNTTIVGSLVWDIAQMYKLKSDPGVTGLQYTKAWHKSQATRDGTVTTEKGGALHRAAISDPTINFDSEPDKGSWPADIPAEIKSRV